MDPFLGVVLVVRQATSQSRVVLKFQTRVDDKDSCFGIGAVEFSKFAMPTQWLMNRKLDFEIEQCGNSLSTNSSSTVPKEWHHLRFVSFPCDCEEIALSDDAISPSSLVTAFNIVFVLDSRRINDEEADLYWQALATLSRALIVEERRCLYLSEQVIELSNNNLDCSLSMLLRNVFRGLSLPTRSVSFYVNGSILTHLSVIPFSQAPEPPGGHQSLILTVKPDSLQEELPVDSASNVRRLIDAADPSKTIKDHMIELGLPMSTIQRISQHLVFWKKAKIMPPVHKRMVLMLNPRNELVPSTDRMNEFRSRFGAFKTTAWFSLLYAFSRGKRLSDVKESIQEEFPAWANRFTELCTFLLSNDILIYSSQFFRYFPPTKRLAPVGAVFQRPKFQNTLPHEIRSEFSPVEFEIIYERLKCNPTGSELMVKFISEYVKRHRDLLTARVELSEQHRCTSEDFQKYTEALMGGYMDSLLVRYESDS